MNPPDIERALLDADLTMEYRRWLPPGKELVLYKVCPTCRQDWSNCRRFDTCQLMGVGAGINAAIRNSLMWLLFWPTPHFDMSDPWPVFKN